MGLFDKFKFKSKSSKSAQPSGDAAIQEADSDSHDQASSDATSKEDHHETQPLPVREPEVASQPQEAPIEDKPAVEDEPATEIEPPQPEKKKGGLFAKFKRGLQKTRQILKTDVRDLFRREGELVDEDFLDALLGFLVKRDIGVKAASQIVSQTGKNLRGRVVHMEEVLDGIKEQFKVIMAQPEQPIKLVASGPTVIMVCGVNGSGKTTSIAKLTHLFVSQGKKVVLGAADTFRAAAVEQLTVWAERIGADIITGEKNSDPASVAFKAVKHALDTQADICIIDTAGRLQTQRNLMEELTKIQRVIAKNIPEAPHEVILVIDATAGQNGLSQAKGFTTAVNCSGIVLAKLDGTAKGGVVVPIRQEFELPVKYIGIGEKVEDLAVFNPDEFAEALFDELNQVS